MRSGRKRRIRGIGLCCAEEAILPSPIRFAVDTGMGAFIVQLMRCSWCEGDALYEAYHDEEWGVPVHDDRKFFEMLVLEGAQAGLSWITVLRKRESYRKAFDQFDPKRVARYDENKVTRLMENAGIIRNRLKITGAIASAQAFLAVQKEFGSFDAYIWTFVGGKPLNNQREARGDIPAQSVESDAMSKDLRKRGFKFVGSTICYAFMQAAGMVNDHYISCPRHREVQRII